MIQTYKPSGLCLNIGCFAGLILQNPTNFVMTSQETLRKSNAQLKLALMLHYDYMIDYKK